MRIALERERKLVWVEWPEKVKIGDRVRYQGKEWEVVTVYYNKEGRKHEYMAKEVGI